MEKNNYNVLFLCTGNSARSIVAEAILQRFSHGKFNAYSAGSKPRGKINPHAITVLEMNNFKTSQFRSKSWDEFSGNDAIQFDFIFTVCGNAANESCPIWPGHPTTAHWGVDDPDQADLPEEQQLQLMKKAYQILEHRIKIFTTLPFDKLDSNSLQKRIAEIGHSMPNA